MVESNNKMEDLFREMLHLHPVDKDGYRIQKDNKDTYDCRPFNDDTIRSWYIARTYVLQRMKTDNNWGAEGITKFSSDRVHIVIHYHGEPMALFIARQVALVTHFLNFREGDGRASAPCNTTVITILYERKENFDIFKELRREEYLCNLPDVCKCVKSYGGKVEEEYNPNSYIDIELELVGFDSDSFDKYQGENYGNLRQIVIEKGEIDKISKLAQEQSLDVTNARRVNMVYNVGADIENLPADDPNTAERYNKALHYFCYQQSLEDALKEWNKLAFYNDEKDKRKVEWQILLRNKLSNVLCADCFELRLKSLFDADGRKDMMDIIIMAYLDENSQKKDGKSVDYKTINITPSMLHYMMKNHESDLLALVKKNLQKIAQCEHARWNVEKLILGFAPFTPHERYEDNLHFGPSRNAYRKKLKNNKGHHIDLCSYHDLRRRNPGDMKFDSFLMMAMVRIFKS
jgi:hypothetical protein